MDILLTKTFDDSLDRLTSAEQKIVNQSIMQFRKTPDAPGLRWHPLNMREARFHSISPNMDLRVIVLADGNRRAMMHVDHHDKAYQWAKGRGAQRNVRTGSMQIVEFEEVVREEIVYVPREVAMPPLFIEESEDYLLGLGVPPVYLPYVMQVGDDDQLLDLCQRLPEEAVEALLALAEGERPDPAPTPAPDADPYQTPDAKRRFWIAADDADLQRALDAPWAQWTTFLHPSQRDAVQRNWGGTARVSGSAGTGKSVVAMHRAAGLARISEGGRLFLTTFSTALSNKLADGMDLLLGTAGEARERVEVMHLHGYARSVLEAAGEPVDIVDVDTVKAWIAEARAELEGDWPEAFLLSEWRAVVDYWGLRSFRAYRSVQRTGRGKALSPRDRKMIWPVFEAILGRLEDSGRMTWGDLCERAGAILTERGTCPFRHVVVDEAQDLGPRELAFVRQLAPEGPRSLFFVGDTGQRIYRWPFAWSAVGLDIRGRSRRLTVNYRTSQQIRRFADRMLPDTIDSPDGAEDRATVSLLSGPEPEIVACADAAAETAALSHWIAEQMRRGTGASEIAVLARTGALHRRSTDAALAGHGLSAAALTDRDAPGNAVCVGTFHSAKGLEFRAVAVIGCEDGIVPSDTALEAENGKDARAIAREREEHLLYVACTRARESMLVTHVGPRSASLPQGSD